MDGRYPHCAAPARVLRGVAGAGHQLRIERPATVARLLGEHMGPPSAVHGGESLRSSTRSVP